MTRTSLVLLAAALAACRTDPARVPAGGARESASDGVEWFVERAHEAGLDFVHFNGMSGEFYFPENMAPGVALLDYDGDGDLDVYLVQGRALGRAKAIDAAGASLKGRLFRNDLTVGPGGARVLHFTDVTDASGIDASGYGMGVAAGDVNNDGCVDLYLTNFGPNQLFRNNCDGTFTDVSRRSGTDDSGFSVSASFVDYDRDGWLDLYVGHYLEYTIEANKTCFVPSGERDYCPPAAYRPQADRLYRNNRDGTFADVTAKALPAADVGPALGVVAADFNNDGWPDIYVANDNRENLLWINQRDGTFRNTALISGAALTAEGKAEASMGVDAGDVDNDGDDDLFMTELTGEGANLLVNDGTGAFDDQSARSGLGVRSLAYTGFGTAWLDFDNDGWLDILTVNGTIAAIEALRRAKDPFPLRQPKQLFRNLGPFDSAPLDSARGRQGGRFEDVTDSAGSAFRSSDVGRGAAFGDIDNDGDVDVLVGNDAGRTQLLINNAGARKHWLGLRLVGARERRDMYGARVAIDRPDKPTLWRRARADGSYASANDPRVLVGLGDGTERPRVRIFWPDGRKQDAGPIEIDRYTTLTETVP